MGATSTTGATNDGIPAANSICIERAGDRRRRLRWRRARPARVHPWGPPERGSPLIDLGVAATEPVWSPATRPISRNACRAAGEAVWSRQRQPFMAWHHGHPPAGGYLIAPSAHAEAGVFFRRERIGVDDSARAFSADRAATIARISRSGPAGPGWSMAPPRRLGRGAGRSG